MTHVTIIGGGIAGLATAFYLQQKSRAAGVSVDYALVEAAPRFGGKIITHYHNDFVIEGGPDSFITQKPWGSQLCRDLGIADRLIPTNDHRRNVYVLSGGRLVPFPGGFRLAIPTEFVPFALSPLISPWGKLRMGMDLFIPPRKEQGDESLAAFFRRRLGAEAVDKIAGPMMGGIYTADAEQLSIQATFPMFVDMERQYGSLIKAMQAGKKKRPPAQAGSNGRPPSMFTSLKGGMKELVDTLVSRLEGDLRLGCAVTQVRRVSPGFEVQFDGPGSPPLATDAVVLALPAFKAAPLVQGITPELAAMLGQIRYTSTANISLAYHYADVQPQHDLNGFGFMVPKSENRPILACTWTSTKFNHRVPGHGALMRVFVGGDGCEHLVDLPDNELLALAQAEIAGMMGVTAAPVAHRIFRWPGGNPQYDVGHLERVSQMESLAAQTPGLFLTGSAFRGIGIPDCVKSAMNTADNILAQRLNGR
jgi:oxygen-dependent protoporphyrinogen oxidase